MRRIRFGVMCAVCFGLVAWANWAVFRTLRDVPRGDVNYGLMVSGLLPLCNAVGAGMIVFPRRYRVRVERRRRGSGGGFLLGFLVIGILVLTLTFVACAMAEQWVIGYCQWLGRPAAMYLYSLGLDPSAMPQAAAFYSAIETVLLCLIMSGPSLVVACLAGLLTRGFRVVVTPRLGSEVSRGMGGGDV